MNLNELTFKVRDSISEVDNILGPCLVENTYNLAFAYGFDELIIDYKCGLS